jgi:hypothetical protein
MVHVPDRLRVEFLEMTGGIGRVELIAALRALVASTGHESAGPKRCMFNSLGCTCGKVFEQRNALAEANRLLREIDNDQRQ